MSSADAMNADAERNRVGSANGDGLARSSSRAPVARLALGQGLFYLGTGIWPLISIGSFQKVTGRKTDLWLVKTVGGLVGVIGGVLTAAGLRGDVPRDTALVAAGSAAVLAAIDTAYVARRRIPPVYLLDAAAELGLIAAWVALRGRVSSGVNPNYGE